MKTLGVALRFVRFLLLSLFSGLAACSRPPHPPPPANSPPPPEKGVTQTLVEDLSGYRQVQQGQRMKEKIKAISAEHNDEMSRVLDDKPAAGQPPGE